MSTTATPPPDSSRGRSALPPARRRLFRYDLFLLALTVLLLFLWPRLWPNLLSSDRFMPHGMCYLWIPELVSLHLISDSLIGLSYVAISAMLTYLVYRARRDIPFHWVFLAFGLFIVACGGTHFMEVLTIWRPVFWLSGYVKLVTAVASVATAFLLPPLLPRVLGLVRAAKLSEVKGAELERANGELDALRRRERQKAEEALRESQTRLAMIVDSAMDAIITVDEGQRVLLFNRAAERMFRCRAAEAAGQPLDRFIPGRFRPDHASHIRSFGETGVTTRAMAGSRAVYGLRSDGEEFPVEASISQVESGGQKLYTVIMRDVTERRRAEESLRESEERYRLLFDNNPAPMWVFDRETLRFLAVNEAAVRHYGYTGEEFLSMTIKDIRPAEEVPALLDNLARVAAGLDRAGVWRHRKKDGAFIDVEVVAHPFSFGGRPAELVLVSDVTERRKAEERFRTALEAAPNAMIMVDERGRVVFANSQMESLFGYAKEELLGQPVEALVPERFRSHHPERRSGFFASPQARPMGAGRNLYGRRKDGREIPVEIGLNPMTTEEGSFVLASIIDITERKRAEEMFRQVIEAAPNGMVMIDREGRIALVNAQVEKSFGYTRDELLGQPIEMLVPERFRARHSDYRDGFVGAPTTRAMGAGRELYGLRKDGTEFPVEIGLNPVETEQGLMVLGTVVDITERKRVEEKLRRSQEQLAGVIGSAMDAIITVDEGQRIVLFNAAAERMFVYPSEDAVGEPLDRFIPERFRAGHSKHVEDFGRTNVTKRTMGALGAIFGLRADGEEFPIEASISQLESEGRKFYTVILRDITERKRADEALKEHARILDLAPVLIRDLEGRILLWNTGAEQMYGWKSEEALDKSTHALLQTVFPRPLEEIKALLYSRGHWEGELAHITKDGEQIVVASHWVLHRDAQGRPKAILEINNDITERKRAEEEIRRLNEELERRVAERTAQLQAANRELEAFSYSVSHDLRAPLRHINGFSQALLEDYSDQLDEAGKSYLQEVRAASQEMAQLIDDVLQLARVTRSEMRSEAVNLSELARAVLAELERGEPGRAASVQVEDGLLTRGDKRLLKIVLVNLLGNAWKFTSKRERAEISFGRERGKGEAVYFVRDNGAGFDMAYAGKLFGAFQRLHTAGEFEGTGIGLATVQRVILRHGGRVWAEGAIGVGATFYFTLPDFKEDEDGEKSDSAG